MPTALAAEHLVVANAARPAQPVNHLTAPQHTASANPPRRQSLDVAAPAAPDPLPPAAPVPGPACPIRLVMCVRDPAEPTLTRTAA